MFAKHTFSSSTAHREGYQKATTFRKLSIKILHHSSKVHYYQKLILGACASIPYIERHVIWKINWNINFLGRFPHFPTSPPPTHSHSPSVGVPWTPFIICGVPTIQFKLRWTPFYKDPCFHKENLVSPIRTKLPHRCIMVQLSHISKCLG